MKILAIDTATDACSTALYVNGELIERYTVAPRKHIELLAPMVNEVMEEAEFSFADLDGLAFSAGPGSFAGLRVACAFVQGLASGLALPIVPVSTLAALALQVLEDHPKHSVLVALDAKMHEVYWGLYGRDDKGLVALMNDQVLPVTDLAAVADLVDGPLIGAGDGWQVCPTWVDALQPEIVLDSLRPRAGEVALLAVTDLEKGLGLFADQVAPRYLRTNIALTLAEQQALRAQKI